MLNVIYPRRCAICDRILNDPKSGACNTCIQKVKYIFEPKCKKCGKPLPNSTNVFCEDCEKRKHYFDRGISLFVYNEPMKNSIFHFKYKNRREYVKFYGQEISRYLGKEIIQFKADALVPVPLYKGKLQRRGFNQAELLAIEIGKNMGIPVKKNLIIRTKNTRPQKELNHTERENNLKKAFKIYQNDVKLNTVVLVDDIYTTGSTVDAIAKILKSQGIQKIYYVTLASGSGK